MTVVPHASYFSLFLQLEIKLKGNHSHPTEVIEAESQAVLNTHRTRLLGCILKMREELETEHTRGRRLLRG
jgi:hypothetical protein